MVLSCTKLTIINKTIMKNYKVDIYNSLSTEAKIKYLESLGDNGCNNYYYVINGHVEIVS